VPKPTSFVDGVGQRLCNACGLTHLSCISPAQCTAGWNRGLCNPWRQRCREYLVFGSSQAQARHPDRCAGAVRLSMRLPWDPGH
jgi:hypothetical protein